MGVLQKSSGETLSLGVRNLVGRSSIAQIVLEEPSVSAEHATIYFLEGQWRIKDLGSRNGTYVDSARLQAGVSQRLAEGAKIGFGQPTAQWTLVDAHGVGPSAVGPEGKRASSHDQSLWLPGGEQLIARISWEEGRWLCEREEGTEQIAHAEPVEINGERWVLELPKLADEGAQHPVQSTLDQPNLSESTLIFYVSQDEEHVELKARTNQKTTLLGSRAHNYLLLLLARKRLKDAQSSAPESECGWVYSDDILTQLRIERSAMNVQIWRANQAFKSAEIPESLLFERRRDSGQIRLGFSQLEIIDSNG